MNIQWGIYKPNFNNPENTLQSPRIVYHDEIRIGDADSSYAEVAPSGGGTTGPTPTSSATPQPTPTPIPTPIPRPVVSLSATPSSLSSPGQATTLLWTVQHASSCTASGSWSGSKSPPGGTERLTPMQSSTYTTLSCTQYQSGSSIPQGFGVPWDVTSPGTLLLQATCTPPTVVLRVGIPSTSRTIYIYKTAYTAPSGASSWSSVDLFGAGLVSNAWYPSFAQGSTTMDTSSPAYYVADTCIWTGTQWKCGCKDNACAQSYWQVQRLQR